MHVLYDEKIFGNPIEQVEMSDNHVITLYHSTIKVFDMGFNLIRQKYFYDKVLSFKLHEDNQLVILIPKGVIQCNLMFDLIALRILKEDFTEIQLFKEICIVKNRQKIKLLSH